MATYSTDFSEYTTSNDLATDEDWTLQEGASTDFEVQANGSAIGGKWAVWDGNGDIVITWDDIDSDGDADDVEILAHVILDMHNSLEGAFTLRLGYLNDPNQTAVGIGSDGGSYQYVVEQVESSTLNFADSATASDPAGAGLWIRARMNSAATTFEASFWSGDIGDEPSFPNTFDLGSGDGVAAIGADSVGVSVGDDVVDVKIDYFAVGTNGDTAPSPGTTYENSADADGVGAATVSMAATRSLTASAQGVGVATVSIETRTIHQNTATAQGVGDASVSIAVVRALTVAADGVGAASADIEVAADELTANAEGVGDASVNMAVVRALNAQADGTADVQLNLGAVFALSASADGVGTAGVTLAAVVGGTTHEHSAAAQGQSTVTANLAVVRALSANAEGVGNAIVETANVAPLIIGGVDIYVVENGWDMRQVPLAADRRGWAGTLRSGVLQSRGYYREWTFTTAKMARADALSLISTLTASGSITATGSLMDPGGVTVHPGNVRLLEDRTLDWASLELTLEETL